MFEWSLIESTALKTSTQTKWYFLGTMAVYATLILNAIVASILLVNPQLREQFISQSLMAPPPPPAPAPVRHHGLLVEKNVIRIPEGFVAPTQTPEILPLPDVSVMTVAIGGKGSVLGGLPGDIDWSLRGGALDGTLGGIAGLIEPPPRQPKKEEKQQEPPRRVSLGVLQGSAIRKVQPVYPPMARATRVQGQVQIEVVIDVDGSVIQATVIDGHPFLQRAALEAAQQWKFRPTLLSGEPIKVTGILIFRFSL
jgi:protein TonB